MAGGGQGTQPTSPLFAEAAEGWVKMEVSAPESQQQQQQPSAAAAPTAAGTAGRAQEVQRLMAREREDAAYDSTASAPAVRCGSSHVMNPSTSMIGGAEVRFVPFAHYKSGNTVVTRAVGYHSDGDMVVLKEYESSNPSYSDTNDPDQRKRQRLTTPHRIEQPLNQRKIESKGLRAFPGVTGPKSKHKHRRWRNQFFIDAKEKEKEREAGAVQHPAKMTKETFQMLYTNRQDAANPYHDSEGEVNGRWAPFIEVTEDRQAALLQRLSGPPQQKQEPKPLGSPEQRWASIGKPLRSELVKVALKREGFFEPVEERLAEYVRSFSSALGQCEEPAPLVLQFEDGYHRLLCHGVVAYYGLVSESRTADDGERYTVIQPPRAPPSPFPLPAVTMLEHVRQNAESGAASQKKKKKKKAGARRK